MALEAPLRPTTRTRLHAFVHHSIVPADVTKRRSSPFDYIPSGSPEIQQSSPMNGIARSQSWSMPVTNPADIVGPSPVNSNGTDFDDEACDATEAEQAQMVTSPSADETSQSLLSPRMSLTTDLPEHVRRHPQETTSVIHAPQGLNNRWDSARPNGHAHGVSNGDSIKSPGEVTTEAENPVVNEPPLPTTSRPTLSTDVKPVSRFDNLDTPQAQTLAEIFDDGRMSIHSIPSLQKIDEDLESDVDEGAVRSRPKVDRYDPMTPSQSHEIRALKSALQECWTLCNTLASLSSIHRKRLFRSSSTPDAHERAWMTCWNLCQVLHGTCEEEDEFMHPSRCLRLCRDFCQALFDIRQRVNEASDSVLRVSFELNNHLYSAHDTVSLPDVFRERTLEFYVTLCHRLMRQRNEMADETDMLLRLCWTLAEMLFSLRQNRREGKPVEEELLVSAVQACWDLCDIFRDGWSQEVRPDRMTPRPATAASFFTDADFRSSAASPLQSLYSVRSSTRSGGSGASRLGTRNPPLIPPTPVTILDDTPMSPEAASSHVPNILVLGQSHQQTWSSSASELSGYTRSSRRSGSTNNQILEDPDLARIKVLILRAAMDRGFGRDMADPRTGFSALKSFVNKLPTGSFGAQPANLTLLTKYKNLVISDKIFARPSLLPTAGTMVSAVDISRSILWMAHHNPRLAFLKDLFFIVFGFSMEEAHRSDEKVVVKV